MGHMRLRRLRRSRNWQEVVALIDAGASAAQIANATITAALDTFLDAGNDVGVVETIWLLTRLPHAARSSDFVQALRDIGVDVRTPPTLMELVGACADAFHDIVPQRARTDFSEIVQAAAADTLVGILEPRTHELFGHSAEALQREVARLATVKEFGIVSRQLFARITERYLDYFVSRELTNHVGPEKRFATLTQRRSFVVALSVHCQEASRIIENFSGEWLSKWTWQAMALTFEIQTLSDVPGPGHCEHGRYNPDVGCRRPETALT